MSAFLYLITTNFVRLATDERFRYEVTLGDYWT